MTEPRPLPDLAAEYLTTCETHGLDAARDVVDALVDANRVESETGWGALADEADVKAAIRRKAWERVRDARAALLDVATRELPDLLAEMRAELERRRAADPARPDPETERVAAFETDLVMRFSVAHALCDGRAAVAERGAVDVLLAAWSNAPFIPQRRARHWDRVAGRDVGPYPAGDAAS